MSTRFLVCAVITLVSAVVSLGFSLAALRGATGQTRVLAFYTCVRSAALVAVAIGAFATGRTPWLAAAALGMILVQAGDAMVGAIIRDRMKTVGPAATALINLAAVAWLFG